MNSSLKATTPHPPTPTVNRKNNLNSQGPTIKHLEPNNGAPEDQQ